MVEYESNKEYPFEIEGDYYSPAFNSLKRIYVHHPEFNATTRLVYDLLFDYWNPEYGYAFPTHYDLARAGGISVGTVANHIKRLTELDLIEQKKSPYGNKRNNVYYIKKPINSLEEFFDRFPEARERYYENMEKVNNRELRDTGKLESIDNVRKSEEGKEDEPEIKDGKLKELGDWF